MLNVVSKDEAVRIVREHTEEAPVQTVNLPDALGRTLARDVIPAEDVPSFDRTTVDGYALCAADTFGAGEAIPAQLEIVGEVRMGEIAGFRLRRGQCVRISTGGMLPPGADAAVMKEHTDEDDGLCLVYRSVSPFENVTKRGDDIAVGQIALRKGTVVTPAGIGVLAALGVRDVPVFQKPVVAVLSTGDEIVTGVPRPGQIRDVNTDLLAAAAKELGCAVVRIGAVRDDRAEIETALKHCLAAADAVLISGGSSAGAKDMTVGIIDSLGEVFFHGIAMKPGKPTIFGVADRKPVFGLPGHPLAAYFVLRLIVSEYVRARLAQPDDRPVGRSELAVNVPSNHGREEYLCVKFDEEHNVLPVHTKSGIVSVLSEAEGFMKIPRNAEGIDKGTTVEIYRL